MASSTGTGKHNAKLIGSKQVQSLQGNTYIDHRTHRQVPARRGRGTPPTKMVFLGSKGWEPSITKSLSFRFHGRIWTCKYPEEKSFHLLSVQVYFVDWEHESCLLLIWYGLPHFFSSAFTVKIEQCTKHVHLLYYRRKSLILTNKTSAAVLNWSKNICAKLDG